MKVAVTDYTFDSLDVERAILEPMGCEIVGPYAKDEPDSLLDAGRRRGLRDHPVRPDRRPGHRVDGPGPGDRPLRHRGR